MTTFLTAAGRDPLAVPDPLLLSQFIETSPWLARDQRLLSHLKECYKEDTPIFTEVVYMLESLGLQLPKELAEVVPDPVESLAEAHKPHVNGDSERRSIPKIDPVPDSEKEFLQQTRRVSIDILQPSGGPVALARAPQTAVSDVSVLTRVTNLEAQDYRPLEKEKKALPKFLNRTLKQLVPKTDKPKETPRVPVAPSNGHAGNAFRRRSLVGENLPVYIRRQLQSLPTADPEPRVSSRNSINSAHAATNSIHKTRDPRIENLLANSQSLYINADPADSGTSQQDFSEESASGVSEADKIYVLPALFTRSLDEYDNANEGNSDEDDDDILNVSDDDDEDALMFR